MTAIIAKSFWWMSMLQVLFIVRVVDFSNYSKEIVHILQRSNYGADQLSN